MEELKAEEIYRGRGPWATVDGNLRHEIFARYFHWLVSRKHRIVLSLIDNNHFFELKDDGDSIAQCLGFPYVAGALQLALAIQKYNQGKKKNKGKTILIFDEQTEFESMVQDLLSRPPEFTDGFYGYRSKDKIKLNQIVDTAYFVKSHYSFVIQTADTVSYATRHYLQLTRYGLDESYAGELSRISGWFNMILERLIPTKHSYPNKSGDIFEFYRRVAPNDMPF